MIRYIKGERHRSMKRGLGSDRRLNAFGTVLAEYSDGRILDVVCGHGGSMWLCGTCADSILTEEKEFQLRTQFRHRGYTYIGTRGK